MPSIIFCVFLSKMRKQYIKGLDSVYCSILLEFRMVYGILESYDLIMW